MSESDEKSDLLMLSPMYQTRRQRLLQQLGQGLAVISSPGMTTDPLLYDKNLFYLTGLDSRQAVLLMSAAGFVVDRWETHAGPEVGRGRKVHEALFVEERSARAKLLDGEGTTLDEVRRISGVDSVYSLSELNELLAPALMKTDQVWVNTPSNPGLGAQSPKAVPLIDQIRQRYYWLPIGNVAPLIHELRRVKEPHEIDCLRRAFALHARIFEKIMRALKPGTNEALGQAIFEYEVTTAPAEYRLALDKYDSSIIVATGKNAAIGHYMANNQAIRDGDLVLLDAGVACYGYSSDISSTFPANGRFTPQQKELYSIVLEAQKKAIATMRPGSTNRDAHYAVYEHFHEHGLAQYGYGNAGHPVGLNIHDPNGDFDIPFEPGVVVVIEPWLAMPDEGLGIRIESGVLITEGGHEVLPEPVKEIEDVEALCRRD
jgi:Xaa-Pro aminopeptidase